MSAPVLVELTIAIPSVELTRVEAFMRELDALSVKYTAHMDSHPDPLKVGGLPEHVRLEFESGAVSQ